MRSNERSRISTLTVARPHRTLGRLLNSCGDFAAAVEFVGRARAYGRADIEYDALVLGVLISYSRPFKDGDDPILGRPLDELPAFLDAAVDLGVDLELHLELLKLGTFPSPPGHLRAQRLAPAPFEHIAHLMQLACVFTLRQIARPDA